MQEEYGIKLRILTESLQSSVNKAKGIVSNFTTKIKADFEEARQPIELNISKNKFDKQISYIEDRIADLKNKLRLADMGYEVGDVSGIPAKIEMLTNKLNTLKQKEKEVGNEAENTKSKLSGISINANMTNNTIVNGFKDAWKSIKRFTFSLLSLRGIYGLVRKASSAYLSQDTQLANQMQKTWASLGALMAPILEKIVKGIRIVVAYVNYFVKALTGKDLIGKAVKKINSYNKSLGGTAKAAKAVNKELTTMDEVTNLTFDDGNINNFNDDVSSMASGFDDFGDIKLDPKITKFLDDLAEKVKQVGKFLKPVIDWAIAHPGAVLTILGGAKLLSLVTKLTGTGGLGTLTGLLKGLATVGVVVAGVDLIYSSITGKHLNEEIAEIKKGLEDLNNRINDNTKQRKENEKAGKKIVDNYKEGLKEGKKTTDQYQKEADILFRLIDLDKKQLGTKIKQYTLTGIFTGANKNLTKQTKSLEKETYSYLKAMGKYYDAGVLNTEQTEKYKKALEEEIKYYKENYDTTYMNAEQTKKYKETLSTLETQLKKVSNGKYVAKTEVDTTQSTKNTDTLFSLLTTKIKDKLFKAKTDVDDKTAESKTKTLGTSLSNLAKTFTAKFKIDVGTQDAKNKIRNFFTSTNNLFKKGSALGGVVKAMNTGVLNALINAIPGYDVGTNYVPNDQLAMVHKGEAIVPKKFNNEQFFNNNNEETNALLVEVNQNLIELRNRPNVLEVNGKELAQATYSDFQNEGSRLNQSMTIKKVGGN